jgi:Ca-activated chloride channel family protein
VSKTEKRFSIAAGDSINVSLDLDVGKLQVSAVYAPNGPKVEKDLTVEVYQPAKADGQKGEWVATEYAALSQFDLPSASYDVTVSVGAAKRVFRTEIKSGAPTRLNVNLDAGVLGLRTSGASLIEIVEAERDINNERRSVHIDYQPQINVALNAGAYVVVVSYPDDTKAETPFTVTAGKRVDLDVRK